MFGFKSRKKFFKSLNPGQIVKYRGYLSDQTVLFEFGHYDEDEDIVYWQYVRMFLGTKPDYDYMITTAKVCDNGKIFEQEISSNQKGWYSLASTREIVRFEECTDKYMTGLWFEGKLPRSEAYLTERMDGRLSRLQLAIDPPEFVYVECDGGEFIFKSAGLSYNKGDATAKIMCKEMFMADDRFNLVSGGRETCICNYDNAKIVRAASESEMKILLYACEEKKKEKALAEEAEIKKQELTKKMTWSEMFDVKLGTMIYGRQGNTEYIFPRGPFKRIEGNDILHYKDGCVKIDNESHYTSFTEGNYSLHTCDSFQILRLATDEEITTYNQKKEEYMEHKNKMYIAQLMNLRPGTLLCIKTKTHSRTEYLVPFERIDEDNDIIFCIGYLVKDNDTHGKWEFCKLTHENNIFCSYDSCSHIRLATDDEQISFMLHHEQSSPILSMEELRTLPVGVMLIFMYGNNGRNVHDTMYSIFEFGGVDDDDHILYKQAVHYIRLGQKETIEIDLMGSEKTGIYIGKNCVTSRRADGNEVDEYNKYLTRGNEGMRVSYDKSYIDDLCAGRNQVSLPNPSEYKFKPFSSKVLVSNGDGDFWCPAVFGCIVDDPKQFMIVGGQRYKFCVLYQNHRDLLGQKFKKEHLNG